ncbi:tRNA pseudouridine synthase A [Olea europaea subsp. europaea]|nr:tRNA pseudouridine synthase A [Olea europaea subsp. europaea]
MSTRPWGKVNDFYSNVVKMLHATARIVWKGVKKQLGEKKKKGKRRRKGAGEKEKTPATVNSFYHQSVLPLQKVAYIYKIQHQRKRAWASPIHNTSPKIKDTKLAQNSYYPLFFELGTVNNRKVIGVFIYTDTWRKDIRAQDIEEATNCAAPGKIRVVSVTKVSREFHLNFSAKWGRLPFNDKIGGRGGKWVERFVGSRKRSLWTVDVDDKDEEETGNKPSRFLLSSVNHLLHQLGGKLLAYRIGPPTECFVFHARAAEVLLPCAEKDGTCVKMMCIELVANRFLRKYKIEIPTCLFSLDFVISWTITDGSSSVATAVREAAAASAEVDALLKSMNGTDRHATAPPARPDGLCLLDVGYTEFDKELPYSLRN